MLAGLARQLSPWTHGCTRSCSALDQIAGLCRDVALDPGVSSAASMTSGPISQHARATIVAVGDCRSQTTKRGVDQHAVACRCCRRPHAALCPPESQLPTARPGCGIVVCRRGMHARRCALSGR